MKKLIVALAAVLMFVCVFTACSGKPEADVTPQGEQTDLDANPQDEQADLDANPQDEQADLDANPQDEQTDNATDSDPQSGVINPLVESSADDVAQQLGFALSVPEGAENVQYFILAGDTEELRFTLNGLDYTARLKATADFEDISGMYYTWTNTLDDDIKGCDCKLMRYSGDDGEIDLCLWYDAAPGLMYSLTTSDSSLDGFDITAVALQVYEPMQKNVQ